MVRDKVRGHESATVCGRYMLGYRNTEVTALSFTKLIFKYAEMCKQINYNAMC